jgi:hypothetical protein
MADSKISALTALAASDVAGTDELVIVDTSVTTTKRVTFTGLVDAIGLNGGVRFSASAVSDGAVSNGECWIYIDTGVSPIVLAVKAKDGSGNVYTGAFA